MDKDNGLLMSEWAAIFMAALLLITVLHIVL